MVTSRGRRSSLEQERSRRSRDALLDAAADLWADAEVDEVKVEDICAHAGVSKGLFYFYFGSKEELVVQLLAEDARLVADEVARGIEHDEPFADVLDAALAAVVRRAQRRPRHLLRQGTGELLADPATTAGDDDGSPLVATCVDLVAHGQARGEVRDDADPQDAGALLATSILRAQLEWAGAERRQPSLARRLAARVDLVVHGLAGR
ncbi:TetR/AcrR family transcriptional regulator [Actinomarinicola tropica]|nr:TetR/AcrR family transcriptional regulator [Actinomarinicola tropica]